MANHMVQAPLIVVLGETATGKSALALQLAQRLNGEILCADSRTVYRSMDIGTAKPSAADQLLVRHYGLDLVDPDDMYTVAGFKTYADRIIDDIASHSKVPIMVGGSGLYIDAVLYDYQFRQPANDEQRQELNRLSVNQLQQRISDQGLELPANSRNPRHLVRVIETGGQVASRSELRPRTILLGLAVDREVLQQRIAGRVEMMLSHGLIEEARGLAQRYGWDATSLQSTSYKALRGYLEGTKSLDQAKADFIQNDLHLAKRQRTWFRRNKSIHWLSTEDRLAEAVDFATTFLSK